MFDIWSILLGLNSGCFSYSLYNSSAPSGVNLPFLKPSWFLFTKSIKSLCASVATSTLLSVTVTFLSLPVAYVGIGVSIFIFPNDSAISFTYLSSFALDSNVSIFTSLPSAYLPI